MYNSTRHQNAYENNIERPQKRKERERERVSLAPSGPSFGNGCHILIRSIRAHEHKHSVGCRGAKGGWSWGYAARSSHIDTLRSSLCLRITCSR